MNSLLFKTLTCVGAIVIWWCGCQGTMAGGLGNWDDQPEVQQHQGELTYPRWFQGRWSATSTLIEQMAPLAPEIVTPGFESNRQYLNQPISFVVQFVPKVAKVAPLNLPRLKFNSIIQPHIVADRAFNGLNIAIAYLGTANVKSVKIDPQNPTKQITQLTQDRQLVTFVTGFDANFQRLKKGEIPDPNHFIATELSQQIFRGNSTIYLNTVQTTTSYQFSTTPTPSISATQISAIYLSPQDPDYFRTLDRQMTGKLRTSPVALYKYKLDLVPTIDKIY